jgi:Papain-like cysteine protease AvrRpt2
MANSIYYTLDGDIPVIAQPKTMACWAAVNTMLVSWKFKESYTIESVMDWLGSDFRQIYENNTGLVGQKNAEWASVNGMKVEYAQCEMPERILDLLMKHGPLIIDGDMNQGQIDTFGNRLWCVHARIIIGIIGGELEGDEPYLEIIDPANGGRQYQESFSEFTAKHEAMAQNTNFQILMIHY